MLEEAGLPLVSPSYAYAVNSVFPGPAGDTLHYVTVFVQAEAQPGAQPANLEPHKCEGWEWVSRAARPGQQPGSSPLPAFADAADASLSPSGLLAAGCCGRMALGVASNGAARVSVSNAALPARLPLSLHADAAG